MFAARLENKLASLEQKLRHEMEAELKSSLGPIAARLAALEVELKAELKSSLGPIAARLAALEAELTAGVLLVGERASNLEKGSNDPATTASAQGEAAPGSTACPPSKAGVLLVGERASDLEKGSNDPPTTASAQGEAAPGSTACPPSKECVATEPVPYMDSAWNLAVVLGRAGVCWPDQALAFVLLVLSVVMQLCFAYVVGGPSFQGSDFARQLTFAEQWRWGIAHDYLNAGSQNSVSLASRVCAGDGALITSTDQRNLLHEINDYLNMSEEDLRPQGFQQGVVLCLLCILLWMMNVCNELRTSGLCLEAVSRIPRGQRSVFRNGSLEVISWPRLIACLTSRLMQVGFSLCYLYSGVLWLAGTTSIQDLILNAVALEAILKIDQIVFSAMMPRSIQVALQGLEPIHVRFSYRRSRCEAALIFVGAAGVLILSYLLLILPLAAEMEAVKFTYCGGNQDFVFASNPDTQVMTVISSEKYTEDRAQVFSDVAVKDVVFVDDTSQPEYAVRFEDFALFNLHRTQSMEDLAGNEWSCEDFDKFSPGFKEAYGAYFRSIAAVLGVPGATTCSELQHFCHLKEARGLRFFCGQSCKCHDPLASIWFHSLRHGCTRGCLKEAAEAAEELPCTDRSNGSTTWVQMWEAYPLFLSAITGIDLHSRPTEGLAVNATDFAETMKENGCAGIAWDGIARENWCEENAQSAPLAHHCPQSCGCSGNPGSSGCPNSCRANVSAAIDA